MVAVLRQRGAGLATLRCAQAGFLSYVHDGPPVDGVFTRNALHQVPDFWKAIALERIARVLRPGGVLRIQDLIYDFRPAEADDVFGVWFDRAASDPSAGYTRDDYIEHIRTEFSTYRWLFEPMLAAAGFEIVSVEYYQRVFGGYTCVKAGG
jgi:SAM-dependent methyltransferase